MEKNSSPFFWKKFRQGVALALCACFLASLAPLRFAYAADKPADISPSSLKVYVQLGSDTEIFTTAEYSSGIIVPNSAFPHNRKATPVRSETSGAKVLDKDELVCRRMDGGCRPRPTAIAAPTSVHPTSERASSRTSTAFP